MVRDGDHAAREHLRLLGGSYSGTAVKSVTRAFASRELDALGDGLFRDLGPPVGIRMCLCMRPLPRVGHRQFGAETDWRRREVGDARKELLEVSLLQAGDRVAPSANAALIAFQSSAVSARSASGMSRCSSLHNASSGNRRGVHRLLELAPSGPALPRREQRALELADGRAPSSCSACSSSTRSRALASRATRREKSGRPLRVAVQPLGVFVHVAQHAGSTWKRGRTFASCAMRASSFSPCSTPEIERCSLFRMEMASSCGLPW